MADAGKKPADRNRRGMKRVGAEVTKVAKAAKSVVTIVDNPLKLGRSFYDQPCADLAQAILGKILVRRLPETGKFMRGTIVETEAYPGGDDKASVSYNGRRTEKIEAMYMDPGTTFVYLTYGMYRMMNISSQGEGSAILLRGIEPEEDYDYMYELRTRKKPKKDETKIQRQKSKAVEIEEQLTAARKKLKPYELANGPGKLCTAFDILREYDKLDLVTSDILWIEENPDPKYQTGNFKIETAPRIGIDSTPPESRIKPWRYFVEDNFSVSTVKPSQIKKKVQELEKAAVGESVLP